MTTRRWGAALIALIALALLLLGAWAAAPRAVAASAPDDVTLVLFHGEGCPHCAAEREFLAGLQQRHPSLRIQMHEVWYDEANRQLLEQTAQRLGFEASGVPVTIIGERVWIGFSDAIAAEIEAAIAGSDAPAAENEFIDVPLVGQVDMSSMSLIASTALIALVDGVNPCSLWVLSLLLAIVLHHGSRRRVLLVGTAFLTVTAGMYALYVVGLYSALDFVSGLPWIRALVAGVALVFGVLQLKDGLRPGTGPSLSIAQSRRPGIYQRIRGVARADQGIAATLAGTVVLAVGVSLLETPCTAGLPLLWTTLLRDAGVSLAAAAALFALYMVIFLLDELVVFGVAVVTLRATKLQEHHGRLLKLLAGSVLVTLATAMLVRPDALDSLAGTAVVFGLAGVLTVVLWAATRRSDAQPGKASRPSPR